MYEHVHISSPVSSPVHLCSYLISVICYRHLIVQGAWKEDEKYQSIKGTWQAWLRPRSRYVVYLWELPLDMEGLGTLIRILGSKMLCWQEF
jgi:hypothetical protein